VLRKDASKVGTFYRAHLGTLCLQLLYSSSPTKLFNSSSPTNKCNLPIGASERLANLARELAGGETAGIKSKLLSFISCTRRQQANNVTGNRQQAEDVEMSDAAGIKSKLLSLHTT